jgi:hypothetical protein
VSRLNDDLRFFSKTHHHDGPIPLVVDLQLCASASNEVLTPFTKGTVLGQPMKPSSRLPDPHKGKLAEDPSNQREATESGRVKGHADH